jgi:hypothetical protein
MVSSNSKMDAFWTRLLAAPATVPRKHFFECGFGSLPLRLRHSSAVQNLKKVTLYTDKGFYYPNFLNILGEREKIPC